VMSVNRCSSLEYSLAGGHHVDLVRRIEYVPTLSDALTMCVT
jgi:hypothetical protein